MQQRILATPSLLLLSVLQGFVTAQNEEYQTITDSPRFIGFYQLNDSDYSELRCDQGLTYGTYLNYGGCMDFGANPADENIITSCQGGTAELGGGDGTPRTCTASNQRSCATNYVYTEADSNPLTQYYCFTSSYSYSLIRELPVGAVFIDQDENGPFTLVGTGATSTYTVAQPTGSPDLGPAPTDPAPQTGDVDNSVGGGGRRRNMAWIAGAVVGPVLALAAAGIFIFTCLRRRKAKNADPNAANPPPNQNAPNMQMAPQGGFYTPSPNAYGPGSPQPPNAGPYYPHQNMPQSAYGQDMQKYGYQAPYATEQQQPQDNPGAGYPQQYGVPQPPPNVHEAPTSVPPNTNPSTLTEFHSELPTPATPAQTR